MISVSPYRVNVLVNKTPIGGKIVFFCIVCREKSYILCRIWQTSGGHIDQKKMSPGDEPLLAQGICPHSANLMVTS